MFTLPLLTLFVIFKLSDAGFYVPDLPTTRYVRNGDVNLGALFPISAYSSTKPCGQGLRSTVILQFVEALVYAIDQINNDTEILPNTTLGFVILDSCLKETTTLSQSLSFIPPVESCQETCSNSSSLPAPIPRYDVVGVVGSLKSSNSIAAAKLLGPIHIPQISYSSTSDELSNKVLYPYFMRVVPPDEFQAEAIVSLISQYGWSYISIVYSEGSYGELGFKNIKRLTNERGICIGTANKIAEGSVSKDYKKAAQDLLDNPNAKVVVIFTGPTQARGLFTALKSLGSTTKFIFIGSDGWAKRINNLGPVWEVALGAFTVSFYSQKIPQYYEYFKGIRPTEDVENPWFREFWEKHFGCSFTSGTPCSENETLSSNNGFSPVSTVTPVMDAAWTFARGIHSLLKDKCPNNNCTENTRNLLNGPELLQYLKNTSFIGGNGLIKFDDKGNQLGRYMLDQLVQGTPYKQVRVATYDALTKQLSLINGTVTWEYINWYKRIHPESVCSKPCGIGEFRIQKELVCCWECRRCRSNEIVTDNGTNCSPCPVLYWPESTTNLTTCSPITPVSITWDEPLAIMLLTLACCGLVGATAVVIYYIKNRNAKCIKASSRELSFLMIGGVFVGYLTVFGLVAKPDPISCRFNFFFFCVSFTWIYGPLLIRTTRIYRIFESGKKSKKRPRFIGARPQMVFALLIILGQVVIATVVIIIKDPNAVLTMPVPTEKHVELSCDLTMYGLGSFLVYNILMVSTNAYFAFRTRKLPDNFNEARFISMCVYTTLIIWLAFIPTYFTAGREYLKTVSLSIALVLNGTVILLFLYIPKIYATIYLLDGKIPSNTVRTKTTKSTGLTVSNSQYETDNSTVSPNMTKIQPYSSVA